jgi:hypothetical protein
MPSFYDSYKPFRNWIGQFDLTSSLVDLWAYTRHLVDGTPLPTGYAVGAPSLWRGSLKGVVYPWDLDTLGREVLLSAGGRADRSLRKWPNLATALNHILRLDDEAFGLGTNPQVDVLIDLNRMAHRQFHWQQPFGVNPMMRVFKIFAMPAMDTIALRELGMTSAQYLRLGNALAGHSIRKPYFLTNDDYSVLKVPQEAVDRFFARITITKEAIRQRLWELQSYDRDWLYTWNPLEATPLVAIDAAFPERALCPVPRHLQRRVSFGIYYDLVGAAGFDKAFGDAFQGYVGDILKATCNAPRFRIREERPYRVGRDDKHGVDWVLSDETGHLFIECKTKRMRLAAKTRADAVDLEKDISTLADAVVQNYRNIQDCLNGKTDWEPDDRPAFSLILMMDDWFIISPKVSATLHEQVEKLLAEAGLPSDIVQRIPYLITSANEFETGCQIIAQVGISPVMSTRSIGQAWTRSLLGVVQTNFEAQMKRVNWYLFSAEWDKIMAPDRW